MHLRLLGIDVLPLSALIENQTDTSSPESGISAQILIENPSNQFVTDLRGLLHTEPGLVRYWQISGAEFILRCPLSAMPSGYLPASLHPLFSEKIHIVNTQIRNFLSPEFRSVDDYGVDFHDILLMGIINVTPDSFSDGGKYLEKNQAVEKALDLEKEGAGIIDIGGESSRPGSAPVTSEEELQRVIPVIKGIRERSKICLSIDTTKAKVAEQALREGANWINDISGLRADPEMLQVAKDFQCPVVIMHMQGIPGTMQNNPFYINVLKDIDDFFVERIEFLQKHDIRRIILDPGVGFGKRLEDNLNLIKGATLFRRHGYPVLYGTSRKSFIGTLTEKSVDQRLPGTLATVAALLEKGVQILRVHDVSATHDFIQVLKKLIY